MPITSQTSFSLPVRSAMAKIQEHAEAVISRLPVPIHEVSMLTLMRTTSKVLEAHPDFRVSPTGQLVPHVGDAELYGYYEVGHALIARRVASQLREEQLLAGEHVDLFRRAVGLIRWRPPVAVRASQLRAFDALVRRIGVRRAGRLLRRAGELWKQAGGEYWAAVGKMSEIDKKRVGDMFGNPMQHYLLHVSSLPGGPIAVYRDLVSTEKEDQPSPYPG